MAGEMNKNELDKGGEWYPIRLQLEALAKHMGSKKFEVKPFDQYQGPYCFMSDLQGSIWLTEHKGTFYFESSKYSGLSEFDGEFDENSARELAKKIKAKLSQLKKAS